MILRISADHEGIFVDTTLFELPSPPYLPPDQNRSLYAEAWITGFALANDLLLKKQGNLILLQNNDVPSVHVLQGDVSEQFLTVAEKLKWDLLPIHDKLVVEIPEGHQDIIEEVQLVSREYVDVTYNIVGYTLDDLKEAGISLEQFFEINLNAFDLVAKAPSDLGQNLAIFSINGSNKKLHEILKRRITVLARGHVGHEIKHEVTQRVPYEIFQKDRFGETVERSIEFIEAGLKLTSTAYRTSGLGQLHKFEVELSSLDSNSAGLPVVSSRKSQSQIQLQPGQVVEVARITMQEQKESKRGSIFKLSSSGNLVDRVAIFAKRN